MGNPKCPFCRLIVEPWHAWGWCAGWSQDEDSQLKQWVCTPWVWGFLHASLQVSASESLIKWTQRPNKRHGATIKLQCYLENSSTAAQLSGIQASFSCGIHWLSKVFRPCAGTKLFPFSAWPVCLTIKRNGVRHVTQTFVRLFYNNNNY